MDFIIDVKLIGRKDNYIHNDCIRTQHGFVIAPVVVSNTPHPPPLPLLLLFTGFLKTIFPLSVSPPAESSLFAPLPTEVSSESGGGEEGPLPGRGGRSWDRE